MENTHTRFSTSPAENEVTDVVKAFATAGDERDLDAMVGLLESGFRVVFSVKDTQTVKHLDRAAYLTMLEEGKAGGVPRELQVLDVAVNGALAHASVTLTSRAARFESHLTVVRRDGRWRLLQDATIFAPGQ